MLQNKKTGEVQVIGDYRMEFDIKDNPNTEYVKVIDWTYYYPYKFESPYAAYLVPNEIKINERVFLEDVIEDLIGMVWNQGDTYRLSSIEAIWNGTDFELDYNNSIDFSEIMG